MAGKTGPSTSGSGWALRDAFLYAKFTTINSPPSISWLNLRRAERNRRGGVAGFGGPIYKH